MAFAMRIETFRETSLQHYSSPLTNHYSLFTIHHSLFTEHSEKSGAAARHGGVKRTFVIQRFFHSF